jgi:hypothetical protein
MTKIGHIESRMSDMLFTPVQDALPGIDVADRAAALKRVPDDKAMLRAVTELTRDLSTPNPRIFWSDYSGPSSLETFGFNVLPLWWRCSRSIAPAASFMK